MLYLQYWWNTMDLLLRILYLIAVPASLILLIQIILTIIGFGSGPSLDAGDASGLDMGDLAGVDGSADLSGLDGIDGIDPGFVPAEIDSTAANSILQSVDPDALRLFSMAGIISFLTVFSWSAIILYQSGVSGGISVVIGFVLGLFAMYGAAKIIQLTVRLSESGNLRFSNAVGHTARIYIPVPAAGRGEGKVVLTLQDRFSELSAVTDKNEMIPTGALVKVVGIRNDTLVVEKITVSPGKANSIGL